MLNKEKYAKEIVELVINNGSVSININTHKIEDCNGCNDCLFAVKNYPYNQGSCEENLKHWANSEYREPKEFTEQERAVIKALDKIEWVVKNKCGSVEGFINKPYKEGNYWVTNTKGVIYSVLISRFTSCEFNSIKWEDTEPTIRAEILGGSEQ